MLVERKDTEVARAGEPLHRSPLRLSPLREHGSVSFVDDKAFVPVQVESDALLRSDAVFEKAGPREKIYFDPARTRAAILTCGGLSPGLNNVIRSVTLELYHNYGVRDILGLRYGFEGLNPACAVSPIRLTPECVDDIHYDGGTVLGTSRGAQDARVMADYLQREGINVLLCVGGDGTQRGTHELAQELLNRKADVAVVGIPKTVDNDIAFVQQTFGFFTAIEKSRDVLMGAHVEAKGARNGIGLVKLMGRDAGFIAAWATLASQEVNFCLVPEQPLRLEGEKGFLSVLQRRMRDRGHAVIVVAEGVGQDLLQGDAGRDASGNQLHKDIGVYLRDRLTAYFKSEAMPATVKYFDPSYYVRSMPADAEDCILCDQFARHAVHAAMAGKTDVLIGFWYHCFVHVPLALSTRKKKRLSLDEAMWLSVLATTGQPRAWE